MRKASVKRSHSMSWGRPLMSGIFWIKLIHVFCVQVHRGAFGVDEYVTNEHGETFERPALRSRSFLERCSCLVSFFFFFSNKADFYGRYFVNERFSVPDLPMGQNIRSSQTGITQRITVISVA